MSRQANNATTWALAVFDSDMSPAQKLICLYLRTHMNDYRDMAWPSVGRIASKCGMTERSVFRHLPEICRAGYLIANGHGPKGTIRYAISTPGLDSTPDNMSPPDKLSPLTKTTDTPDKLSPELNKELTNVINGEKWGEWICHLKAKRKTPPPTTVSKQQAMLAKYDKPTQAIIIDQSIMNNWQGLFPPKEPSHASNRSGGNPAAHQPKPTPAQRTEIKRQEAYRRESAREASAMGTVETDGRDVWTHLGESTG